MSLIKRRKDELNPFFDTPWAFLTESLTKDMPWSPSLDIAEGRDKFVIKAELPGVKQSDINVCVEGEVLNIEGERKKEQEVKEKKYHRIEIFYGTFSRSLVLPDYVDASKINAAYKDGVLELTLPKKEKAKPKEIKININ